jgi:hypothetical protein
VTSQDPTRGDDEAEVVIEQAAPAGDVAAAAAAAMAAPVEEVKVEEVAPPTLPPAPADDGDDDDAPALDEAAAAERRAQKEARRAARLAHKQAMLAQKQALKQQEEERRKRQAAVGALVQSRADKSKQRMSTLQGARLPASGSIIGRFDEATYDRINGASGGWQHFLSAGFNDGCLVAITTPVGVFAGIFDYELYLHRNGMSPVAGDQPPFHPQQQAFQDLQGKSSDMPIPIRPAMALTIYGQFATSLYFQANPDAVAYSHKPRAGAFDGASYLKLHRDVRGDPLEHYANHGFKERREIVVNGRRGRLDKRWFKRTHDAKKVAKHLKKKPNSRMKVKGRRMNGWQHYATYGHSEGRRVRVVNGLGVFEGVFDAQGYAAINPDAGARPWEHYREHGYTQGRALALTNLELVSLFLTNFEEVQLEPSVDPHSLAPPQDLSSAEEDDGDDDDDDGDDED